MAEARLDKWLWAVRIFKTRSIAAEACKKNRVSVNEAPAKASKMVKPGDIVSVRKPPITYSFQILQSIDKRVGAKLVPDMMKNVTPPEEYEALEMTRVSGFVDRAKGTGRPTKKDRRRLEEFIEPAFFGDIDDGFDDGLDL
ncbi:RNA-binding S4 domain protein [Bacteroides coprosuis DSM 18011]|uniref:RNA-binding S4 domain protein n=1 Tax=Bacteroides coprosuis DSM 18011 TaxID=679937 RepID=F3ZNI9_9BACE|nr:MULTISPECIES: RNA-binding S4 domain-containing protein [Bacteroides]EGJ72524.1 RNA-binding S4 domain protein [Bacteroides coprosuis DSM 18011]HJD93214.1 RNA-binding S4 domain-containing protein [Bacteroides coprosuis]